MPASTSMPSDRRPTAPRWGVHASLRQMGYGFLYWAAIVTALEPGNVANMLAQGDPPRWSQEVLRIVGAGLIGSGSVPLFVALSRSFPVARPCVTRNALIHLTSAVAVAAFLIVLAHIVATELLTPGHRLTAAGLRGDLAANELLLVFGLVALSGLAHISLTRSAASDPPLPTDLTGAPAAGAGVDASAERGDPSPAEVIDTVEVKVRGLTKLVAISQIDWIESQGNYLALHIGASTVLVRATLSNFQARLDPARFVRIHRRIIVAVDRIVGIEPAANGDGAVRLRDNRSLKASRLYRRALVLRSGL